MFGGNFKGIESKISHLVELGVNAVYMTPISLSPSCHRYDTTDYLAIDPRLGTEDEFKRLVEALHRAGIRIVLDAVFNHCGAGFYAFQDVLKNQEKSIYKDWFLIDSFPVAMVKDKTYQTFASEMHMPKLNSADPGLQDYPIRVGKHYIERFGIDGWRLDVADEVDSVFWRRFRQRNEGAQAGPRDHRRSLAQFGLLPARRPVRFGPELSVLRDRRRFLPAPQNRPRRLPRSSHAPLDDVSGQRFESPVEPDRLS
ncbi:MAG: alpha-amylase family glycosyl hydrolase [Bacillus subtilis]|nr:alpha-amylase family glycosyl hydrolase [Bacillus subtilis]